MNISAIHDALAAESMNKDGWSARRAEKKDLVRCAELLRRVYYEMVMRPAPAPPEARFYAATLRPLVEYVGQKLREGSADPVCGIFLSILRDNGLSDGDIRSAPPPPPLPAFPFPEKKVLDYGYEMWTPGGMAQRLVHVPRWPGDVWDYEHLCAGGCPRGKLPPAGK